MAYLPKVIKHSRLLTTCILIILKLRRELRDERRRRQQERRDAATYVLELEKETRETESREGMLRRQVQDLLRQTLTDPLTGLYNRAGLERKLLEIKSVLSRAGFEEAPFTVAVLDLDNFKYVNDHRGHDAGDTVLREFAKILHASFRRSQDIVSRVGGDEFIVVMPYTEEDRAGERIAAMLYDLWLFRDALKLPHELGVSIGIETLRLNLKEKSLEEFKAGVIRADDNMYRAKKEGGNRFLPKES